MAKMITGVVRLAYVRVFEPHSMNEGADPKYSVCVIVSKDDEETISRIKMAVEDAKKEGESKWGGKIPKNLKLPLRDGDLEREDQEEFENCYFFNCSSKQAPGIVDVDRMPIFEQSEIYSGIFARVSVNFYAFNSNGNRGIACGLNNIQKIRDGQPLNGRTRAEDDFNDELL